MLTNMSPAIFSAWTYVLEATNDLFNGADSFSGTSPKGATSDMLSLTHTKYLCGHETVTLYVNKARVRV